MGGKRRAHSPELKAIVAMELARERECLQKKVGELTMDVDFLKKSAFNWGFR